MLEMDLLVVLKDLKNICVKRNIRNKNSYKTMAGIFLNHKDKGNGWAWIIINTRHFIEVLSMKAKGVT